MKRTRILITAVAASLAGAAALISTPAAAGGNVAWNVSVGGPGFAVSAGQPRYYGAPYHRPHYKRYYRAAPVVYSPWYPPYRVYAPQVYAPRVVVAPRPYYAPPYGVAPY